MTRFKYDEQALVWLRAEGFTGQESSSDQVANNTARVVARLRREFGITKSVATTAVCHALRKIRSEVADSQRSY